MQYNFDDGDDDDDGGDGLDCYLLTNNLPKHVTE